MIRQDFQNDFQRSQINHEMNKYFVGRWLPELSRRTIYNWIRQIKTGKSFYQEHKTRMQVYSKQYHKDHPWVTTLRNIKKRCNEKDSLTYAYYGGRGIKCFLDFKSMKYLWFRDKAYLLKKPSIDRIDNNGHYCVENCRFIEMSENLKRRYQNKVVRVST